MESVTFFGTISQSVFGPVRKEHGKRCLGCEYADKCEYFWDITKDSFSTDLYRKTEKDTGYIRDKCVFSEDNDIWDATGLNVKYDGGAMMTMTICVYSPYEGWHVSITGTEGRLEAEEYRTGVNAKEPYEVIKVIHRDNSVDEYKIGKNEVQVSNDTGIANYTLLGHNGGDAVLRRMLFVGDIPDKWNQMAGTRAAIDSVLVGAGAVKSIQEGIEVKIADLLTEPLE